MISRSTAGINPKVISWRLEGAEQIRVDSDRGFGPDRGRK